MPDVQRTTAAFVTYRNGAWLIAWSDQTADLESDALYDCASSLVKAKRIAVEGARGLGYTGAVRWSGDKYQQRVEMSWDQEIPTLAEDDGE